MVQKYGIGFGHFTCSICQWQMLKFSSCFTCICICAYIACCWMYKHICIQQTQTTLLYSQIVFAKDTAWYNWWPKFFWCHNNMSRWKHTQLAQKPNKSIWQQVATSGSMDRTMFGTRKAWRKTFSIIAQTNSCKTW